MELVLLGDKPLTQGAFLSGEGSDSLVIDATRLTFACPLDLVGIVATAFWASDAAFPVTLRLPADLDVAAYLQRMDVLRQMPPRTQILGRLPPDVRADRGASLLEVTPLNDKNVNDLDERVGALVTDFYQGSSAGAAAFLACSELMSNATEHGTSERGAFLAIQLHTGTSTDEARLEFAVCDTGMGVMNHLRRNPRYALLNRDELAIARALKAGVSGVDNDRRGHGLSDAIGQGRRHGRVDLRIRSGTGEVRVAGTPSRRTMRPSSRSDRTNGTWAWLTHRLPASSETMVQSEK
ncbi:hypothetical protein acdb102_42410 [Acidothermaceae bacterium B102]|nr:hypothetical protein acdb102_42410 [Acidothermaceae bacterium B102]